MESDPSQQFAQVRKLIIADGRYALDAYEFLTRGLNFTEELVFGKTPREKGQSRHVSGQQLCHGLRLHALKCWGPLAATVLRSWGIRTTRDFGEMVFLLVNAGWWGAQPSDRVEDFDHVYDFDQAFAARPVDLESPPAESE